MEGAAMWCKFTEGWRRFGLLPGGEAMLSKLPMSALGHEQTSRHVRVMSVYSPQSGHSSAPSGTSA